MLSCGSAFVCVLKQEQEETQRRVWMWRSGETIRRATKMSFFCDSCLRLMGAFNGGRDSASRMWMKSYTVPTPPLPYSGCFSPSIGVHIGSAWKFDTVFAFLSRPLAHSIDHPMLSLQVLDVMMVVTARRSHVFNCRLFCKSLDTDEVCTYSSV